MKEYKQNVGSYVIAEDIRSREEWERTTAAEEQLQRASIFGKELKQNARRI